MRRQARALALALARALALVLAQAQALRTAQRARVQQPVQLAQVAHCVLWHDESASQHALQHERVVQLQVAASLPRRGEPVLDRERSPAWKTPA